MRLPAWPRRMLPRRKRRLDVARQRLMDPVRLSFRRLEERRVLDVSAAFMSTTGMLSLQLSGDAEAVTLSAQNGKLVVTNANQDVVEIQDETSMPTSVGLSELRFLGVTGDAATDQSVHVNVALSPFDGLSIDASIETVVINQDITRVSNGDVNLNAGRTELAANIEASNVRVVVGGDLVLGADVKIEATDVTFTGRIDDDGDPTTASALEIEASGITRFGGEVGGLAKIDRLVTDAAGRTELNADISASSGTLIFNDPVLLTSSVALSDTGPTGITFNNTIDSEVDGQHTLELTATAGRVTFNGNVGDGAGGDQRLGSLTVTTAAGGIVFGENPGIARVRTSGSVNLGSTTAGIGGVGIVFNGDGGSVTTTPLLTFFTGGGSFRLNGQGVLQSNLLVDTDGGDFVTTADAPIDSGVDVTRTLTINAHSGAVMINEDIGNRTPLGGLTIISADGGIVFGGADMETGGLGPVALISTTGPIELGTAANVVGGVVFNAGDGNTLVVKTTGDQVRVNGAVELGGHLEIDTGANAGDVIFTVDAPIDSQSSEENDVTLNAGQGGVFLNADLGRIQSVGRLRILRADAGVTFGQADGKTVDGGQGPVTLIRTSGEIDLGVGSNQITGSGITLNAGSGSLTIETASSDVRINGRLTLASHVAITTGIGAGDIVFTNDTPVDSSVGETNNLGLFAGSGTVRFNEDLGAISMLGRLTVDRAEGGVLFGESTTEIPGDGGRGPVNRIRVMESIDIGVGANVIQGLGIVLTGGAVNGLHVSTVDAAMRFNGAVTLGNAVRLETGSGGGDITFTHDSPIDSGMGRTSDLSLDAGAGRVSFNQDIGATVALGGLAIERAEAGVQFGNASTGVPNTGGMGPVEIVHARRGIDVGVGINVIGGDGIDVNGGTVAGGGAGLISFRTDNTNIRFNGDLDLQSSARFDTANGAGDVVFTSGTPIDSSDGPESALNVERNSLTVNAGVGQVIFNANLGESQRLGEFTIERAAGGIVFGGADGAVAGGAGPVTVIATDGAINLGAGSATDNVIDAGIVFNGGAAPVVVSTSDDLIRLNGPVTAASKLVIDTNNGDLLLTAVGSLNSQANESNDVMIDLGTGDGTFDATIGDTSPLGELQIVNAHDVTFAAAVSVARISQLAGSGTATFNGAIDTTDGARAGIELTGTDVTLNAPITTTGDGRVIINQSGRLDINDNANMRLYGAFTQAGGAVETAADIVTSGDAIEFGGAVRLTDGLAGNVRLDTTDDGNVAGARVSFLTSLDGETDASETLHVNSGTANDVLFMGAVGSGVRVRTIDVIQARDVTFGGEVVVGNLVQAAGQGTTAFTGPVDANSPLEKALDLATVNVTFTDTVTTQGDGTIEVTVTGLLDIGMAANMNLNGTFLQDGGGMTLLSANIVTSNDNVQFSDAVILGADVSIDTGMDDGDVTFLNLLNGQVDCGQNLTLSSGTGELRFAGAVGGVTALGDLAIVIASDVTFQDSLRVNSFTQQDSSGHSLFAESVVIKGAAGFDATVRSIRFDGDVDTTLADGPIRVAAAEDITVNATLGSGTGAVTLIANNNVLMTAAGAIVTSDAVVSITADANNTGGGVNMADGATVRTGAAAIQISAGDDVRLGGLTTTGLVTVTSQEGGIVDGGDVDGFDITADRLALQARHGIGRDNPLDIRVRLVTAHNAEEGGIRFDNRVAGTLTIGTINGLTGIKAGPDTPADLGGDIEISHIGTIDVDASIQNNAGGHTIVRAENPGNLNVNQPIQNRGGDGWIFLYAGEDLIINNSLPEFINGDPAQPFLEAEISVQNEGAIRGQARGRVIVDNSDTDYVIIRTHAERFPDAANLPTLSQKFLDPADFPENDPAFYAELDAELAAQRNAVSAQITNVAPVFDIESVDQGGSNLDEKARGILKITIGDDVHLERNFHVTVDWGDGIIENYTITGNPKASRGFILASDDRSNIMPDATITASFDSGKVSQDGTRLPGPGVYFIHHTYIEPPDLGDPAAPIPVFAEIRYDARSEGETDLDIIQPADGSAIFNGIRFFENLTQEIISVDSDIMTNPGQGAFAFIKVIESEIIPVELRKITTAIVNTTTLTVVSAFGEQFDLVTAQFETQVTADYRLFFTVVDDVKSREFGDFSLPNARISNPISVFTKDFHFPNGHYRVYLEDLRTKRRRLILEVHIYEGRVVPPNFRQGATERQAGSDAVEDSGPDAQPPTNDGAARQSRNAAGEMAVAPALTAENARSAATTRDNRTSGTETTPETTSAAIGGAAAWLALNSRLRRGFKRPESNKRRLDKAARIARRLRDKFIL